MTARIFPARGTAAFVVAVVGVGVAAAVVDNNYALSVMVLAGMYIVFALSYDLSVGHVGAVHLAPAAFFGLGAYVTALVGVPLGLSLLANMLLSGVVMVGFSIIVGRPSFRLSNVTFAIGTLAFATMAQQFVNSAVDLTRGPLCVQGIPHPIIGLPGLGQIVITSPRQYVYLLLPFVVLVVVVYRMLTASRIGRAFATVRMDEVLAASAGVRPLQYKMLAFAVGAGLAGALGSFQAHYLSVVCPTELATDATITLLIIVFVGGAGSLPGILVGAVVFTVLPELLRGLGGFNITPAHQLVVFGLILLLVIKYAPGGLRQLWTRPPTPPDDVPGAPEADDPAGRQRDQADHVPAGGDSGEVGS